MMVVAAGRDEGRAGPAGGQGESEHAAVEIQRSLQIGDLQMDMADPHPVVDGGKLRQRLFEGNRLVHDAFLVPFAGPSFGRDAGYWGLQTHM